MTSKEVDNTILSVTFITVIGIVIAQFITGAVLLFAPQVYDRTLYHVLLVLCPVICLLIIYRHNIWSWISKLKSNRRIKMTNLIKIIMIIGLVAMPGLCFADEQEVVSQTYRIVTAYNVGDPNQTDDTPCIDAKNTNICEALDQGELRCAANFVRLGTKIHIDKIGTCLVTDRTNRRYKNRVDVAMKKHEKKKALKFGRQKLLVKILKDS